MGAGQFQGTAQPKGEVRVYDTQGGDPPLGSQPFRGYLREQLGSVLLTKDIGQARSIKGGLAFSLDGQLLYDDGPGPFPNRVGGLAVNAQGGVSISDLAPQTFLSGVGLRNEGNMTQEKQPAGLLNEPLFQGLNYNFTEFRRFSEGLEQNNGVWRARDLHIPRFEDGMLLMEPLAVNIVKCNNYNPDEDLTNIISGVPIRRIYKPEVLAQAGLTRVCPSGYVIEAFNNSFPNLIIIEGYLSNTSPHVSSVFMKTFEHPVSFGIGVDRGDFVSIEKMTRVEHRVASPSIGDGLTFLLDTGARVWFILPQLEVGEFITSPIRTEIGFGAFRDVDTCRWTRQEIVLP